MTTSNLARRDQPQAIEQRKELSLHDVVEMTGYDLANVALIRHNMAAGMRVAVEDVPFIDIAMFCKATKSLGLDPLVKQAYWISRQGKGGLQIGIDGFRAIADRAGNYAGSEPPVFRGTIEWEHRGRVIVVPEYCQVTTWKIVQGHKCAFTGESRWVEYVPKVAGAGSESDMWAKMPRNQLAKCAEAQSLRKGWALQMGSVTFRADETDEAGEVAEVGELPTVAAPRQVIEQVRAEAPRPTRTTDDYERVFGDDAKGTAFADIPQTRPAPPSPEQGSRPPAAETLNSAAVPAEPTTDAVNEALSENAALLEDARGLNIRGLGPHTAKQGWPFDKIVESNIELKARLRSHASDDQQAEHADQAQAF